MAKKYPNGVRPGEKPDNASRVCLLCKESLPLGEFFPNPSAGDGVDHVCKDCSRMEAWYRIAKHKHGHTAGKYQELIDHHSDLASRYKRLSKGLTARECALDEMFGEDE
jgi:hypothetical protein